MAQTRKPNKTTQKFTELIDIVDDIAIFTGGNACLVLEVTATNFALLSAEEQDAKLFSYAALLNSLSFPIQILIRSKKLDISTYVNSLQDEQNKTTNPKLAEQIGYYKEFVQELVKVNVILDKKFYLVINYTYLEGGVTKVAERGDAAFISSARTSLHSKAESLLGQLGRLNLKAKVLSKEELVKLYYDVYNDVSLQGDQIVASTEAAVIKG